MSDHQRRAGIAAALKAVFLPQLGELADQVLGLHNDVDRLKTDVAEIKQAGEMERALRRLAKDER